MAIAITEYSTAIVTKAITTKQATITVALAIAGHSIVIVTAASKRIIIIFIIIIIIIYLEHPMLLVDSVHS